MKKSNPSKNSISQLARLPLDRKVNTDLKKKNAHTPSMTEIKNEKQQTATKAKVNAMMQDFKRENSPSKKRSKSRSKSPPPKYGYHSKS